MSKQRPLILLTRPQVQAERFAKMCRAALGADAQIISAPLIKIEMLPVTKSLVPYAGLVFTSQNGVQAFAQAWDQRGLPAYCVGDRTAKAARMAGMQAFSANGSANDLVAMLGKTATKDRYLHIHGEHTRGDIAKRLAARIDEIVAYRQTPVPLTDEAHIALQADGPIILPLFSPRTTQLFFNDVEQINAPLRIVVLSQAVGKAAAKLDSAQITVAATPDAAAMIQAIKGRINV